MGTSCICTWFRRYQHTIKRRRRNTHAAPTTATGKIQEGVGLPTAAAVGDFVGERDVGGEVGQLEVAMYGVVSGSPPHCDTIEELVGVEAE
jgi:hypothetical protein